MKKNMIMLSMGLIASLACLAQMRTSVTVEDYKKCIEYCKGLDNSSEREICMRGCANVDNVFTTVSVKTLERAPSLITKLMNRKWSDGENEVSADAKKGLRYYAIVENGRIVDYSVKDNSGNVVPSKIVSVAKERKRCFIWINGELVEVTCPDVIIIVPEKLIR